MQKVGVLALQGDVEEHSRALSELGADPVAVRGAADLGGLDGLILPGGESTTMSLLLESSGLAEPIGELLTEGMPVFGTCAGMILLARRVIGGRPDQRTFGAIDLTVRRNGYGRQVDSFETDLTVAGVADGAVHAIFIRAPLVTDAGPAVEVLASLPGPDGSESPVLCRQGPVLVAAFHPELSGDLRIHHLFLGGR